jgi:hypothetical protein
LIPEKDFCAPADLTEDVTKIMSCLALKGETVCAPPCKWRRGKQPATEVPTADPTNDDINLTGNLFTQNFCHPVTTTEWDANVKTCLPITDK